MGKSKILNFSLLYIVVFSLLISSFVFAATVTSPDFTVTLENQDPNPVEPGEVVTLEFKVKNSGTETKNDVIIEIDPSYPFTLYESESSKNIGSIKNGKVVSGIEYRLLVDDSAAQGEVEVKLHVYEKGSSSSEEYTIKVDIETRDAVLDISSVEIDPSLVGPGDQFDLIVTLMNEADSLLQSIYATVNTSEGQPVAAYFSSAEKVVKSLSSGEGISLHYKLIVDPSIEPGLYRMPFELEYEDRSGNSYSSIEYLSLIVLEPADLDVQLRSSEIWVGDRDGKIVLEIANRGLGELKALQLDVLDGEGYKVISAQNSFYIGNIDSDDTETQEVVLSSNWGHDGLLVNVGLRYLDSINQEYFEEFIVQVPVYSKSEAIVLGIIEEKSYTIVFIILMLLLGGFYYWFKRRNPNFKILSIFKKYKNKRFSIKDSKNSKK